MADAPHLTVGQRTALSVPPLLLRLALAVTFIWAGYAKVFGTFPVTDDNRAGLIAAGVLPEAMVTPAPPPADQPEPAPEPAPEPETQPEPPATSPVEPAPGEPAEEPMDDPGATAMAPADVVFVAQASNPDRVRNLNGLAVVVNRSANPAPVEVEGETRTPMPLMPATFGTSPWPVRLAWAAALTELIAGGLLLIGLFTRIGGLAVAGVMGMAMWLTQIGPAIQSSNAWLGFLPMNDPWNVSTYSTFLWQLTLLAAGLALLFSGPGMLSLDRWIFGKSGADDED